MNCSICRGTQRDAFRHKVLGEFEVRYFYCDACGFLCSEPPYWLERAYASPISALDTGIMARNINTATRLAALLYAGFGDRGRTAWLDYAGGLGILVRLMRDRGFDFRWQDRYASNLFARGFDHRPGTRYRGVTAIEVIEHAADPAAFIEGVLDETGAEIMLFTTELFSGPPPPMDWWYYDFSGGQHVSFFQKRTIQALGSRLRLHTCSSGSLHCYSKAPLSSWLLRLTTGRLRFGLALLPMLLLPSKTMADHELLAAAPPPQP